MSSQRLASMIPGARVRFGSARLAALLTGVLLSSSVAFGQPAGQVPPVPTGPGRIEGRVIHLDDPAKAGGLPVALYALSPSGQPGLDSTTTDADGRFAFENVSVDPSISYLVGVRYGSIPYGTRTRFDESSEAVAVEIEVGDPTADPSAIRVVERLVKLDQVGQQVVVQEVHRLRNSGNRVVLVPSEKRAGARPAFEALLPEGARDFQSGAIGFDEGLVLDGRRVVYWGPIYQDDQEIRFQYALPATGSETVLSTESVRGADRIVVLSGGLTVEALGGAALERREAIEIDGRSYAGYELGRQRPGAKVSLQVALAEARVDPGAVRVPRADFWLELDDTALTVTADLRVSVRGDAPVVGPDGAPLLRFELPPDATLDGIAPASEALGLRSTDGRTLEVMGPLPPGDQQLGFALRMPAAGDGSASLAIPAPAPIDLLNVLVADTGIVIESDRLHRRRPFRSGTRNYLHREAFQIPAGEDVRLRIEPIRGGGVSDRAAMAVMALGACAAAFFIGRPLQRAGDPLVAKPSTEQSMSREREGLLESIRDLDHDFETGKLEEADYERMRTELRGRAIDSLRRERDGEGAGAGHADAGPAAEPTPAAAASTGNAAGSATSSAAPAAFCTSCGAAREASWKFCARCGAALADPRATTAGRGDPEPV